MSIRRVNTSYIHSIDSNQTFGNIRSNYRNVSGGLGSPQFLITPIGGSGVSVWTKPPYVNYIDIILVGGGGGGGNSIGGGGGGGAVTYIKKFFVGDTNTWYYYIGDGGTGGNVGNWDGSNTTLGAQGQSTFFSPTNTFGNGSTTISSSNWNASTANFQGIGNARVLISPGGGGGGPTGEHGFSFGSGGGSGSGTGTTDRGIFHPLASRTRTDSPSKYVHPGFGFQGGGGNTNSGGGGGSCKQFGSNSVSTTVGGNGANGVDLRYILGETFVNSSSAVTSCIFGGGGGGAGSGSGGTGGLGGGGNAGSAGTQNTGGGGGGGSGKGGSGIIIIRENTG
jgi:hypothetical protein